MKTKVFNERTAELQIHIDRFMAANKVTKVISMTHSSYMLGMSAMSSVILIYE